MLNPTYPGIYTREMESGVRTVTGAPTSVALFIGPTLTGIDLRPITCLSYADFERNFGGLSSNSWLSYSVMHFFANGGGQAVVIRVPAQGAVAAASTIRQGSSTEPSITVTALSAGTASGSLFLEIDSYDLGGDPKRFNLTVTDPATGRVERFPGLTTIDARRAETTVNDPFTGSKLIKLKIAGLDAPAPQATGSVYPLKQPFDGKPGTFVKDVAVNLKVALRAADGSVDTTRAVESRVVVFPSGAAKPTSPLELVTRLVFALNKAIRADTTAAASLAGAAVEGALHENGTRLRLTLSRAAEIPGPVRVHDGTITLAAPTAATGQPTPDSFLDLYIGSGAVTNPSRYRLGHAYAEPSRVINPVQAAKGDDLGQPPSDDFLEAITGLDARDPFFNLLCLPDLVRPTAGDAAALHHPNAMSVYAEAARICAEKHAFLLIDPPPYVTDIGSAEAWKSTGLAVRSTHAGAWFPTIRVDDPLRPGVIINHPPSGAVAGVIARTDGATGIWQAPAGTDAFLAGVYGPSVEVSDREQGLVNPLGLNVIRRFPVFQTVAFGSRTIDGADALASEWKYIPVRRTSSYILRSLSESLRWAVHKPNGEQLWSQLRVACTAFMQGMFRQGAFKGTSARQAYFVACDGTTTTQEDIDLGRVNITIGFAPLKPAEFVVISLQQIVQPAA